MTSGVIELSGIPAPNMQVPRDRLSFLSRRVERIRHEMLKHRPELIVMYGVGQRETWEQIAETAFDSNGICCIGNTIAAIARHPVTVGLGNEYWVTLGRSLHSIVGRCDWRTL